MTAGASGLPVFPAPSFIRGLAAKEVTHSSGETSRESAKLCLPTTHAVIARLDRAIQYSRDRDDSSEMLRRTGFFAGACHRARQRRDPVAGNDSTCWRDRTARQAVIARSPRQNCVAILRRSDEAIQKSLRGKTLDCFASLAMTRRIHRCATSSLPRPGRSAPAMRSIVRCGSLQSRADA